MNKSEQLTQLINSMTKAEKRYFKLLSNLQKGKKEYLYIYDKLENCESLEKTNKALLRKFGKKRLDASLRYLYDQVLNCLVFLEQKVNIQSEIFYLIEQASLLYKRRFVKDALGKLSKAKQLAQNFEQDTLLLLIRRTEIIYIMENDFMDLSEKELVSKHTKLNECLKFTRSTNMHISLFSTLNYRLYNLEHVRSNKQKETMNDLVLSELNLMSSNYYHGFESIKLHLLFQASYYLHTGSYKSAIRYYTELLSLFDEYDHLKRNPPIYYLSTIEGIINSLLTTGIYNEIPLFIQKLKELDKEQYPEDFLLKVRWVSFISQAEQYLHTGSFQNALQLCIDFEDNVFKKLKSLNLEDQLKLHLSIAIIYLCNEDMKKARKHIKKIMQEGKLFKMFSLYRIARLLSLIINVELNDYELLENEIRSIKRAIRDQDQAYMTEKLILKFVLLYPIPIYKKTRSMIWRKLEKEIIKIHENKYEKQIIKVFNFPCWIESKLTDKSFADILYERNLSQLIP